MATSPTAAQLSKNARDHLAYELSMIYLLAALMLQWRVDTAEKLERAPDLSNPLDLATVNGVLEAFLVKARLLRDFFYPKANLRSDDVVATHYVPGWSASPIAPNWDGATHPTGIGHPWTPVGKGVAHFTLRTGSNVNWPVMEVADEIDAVVSTFLAAWAAVPKQLGDQVKQAKEIYEAQRKRVLALTVGANPSSMTITTASVAPMTVATVPMRSTKRPGN